MHRAVTERAHDSLAMVCSLRTDCHEFQYYVQHSPSTLPLIRQRYRIPSTFPLRRCSSRSVFPLVNNSLNVCHCRYKCHVTPYPRQRRPAWGLQWANPLSPTQNATHGNNACVRKRGRPAEVRSQRRQSLFVVRIKDSVEEGRHGRRGVQGTRVDLGHGCGIGHSGEVWCRRRLRRTCSEDGCSCHRQDCQDWYGGVHCLSALWYAARNDFFRGDLLNRCRWLDGVPKLYECCASLLGLVWRFVNGCAGNAGH
jgi:hypothetical protein